MLKKDRLLASLSVIFVLTEVALGILLQTSGRYSAEFSYAAIAVSALFCLLLFTNTANFYLTQLGLLFTLAADYFLVLVSPRE